jgi:hypothetical protein
LSYNATNMYDVDAHVAEIYDQVDTQTGDIALLRGFLGPARGLRILEPFCGTGRILIPPAAPMARGSRGWARSSGGVRHAG